MGYELENHIASEEHKDANIPFIVKDEDHLGEVKKVNCLSSVVPASVLHRIQSAILKDLSSILANSFGPHGSNTCIKKLNAFNTYSKDGHTILSNVYYNGIIEQSIKDDIESITRNIVNTVGDGTTSAVLMSNYIFDAINTTLGNFKDITAGDVMRAMDKIGKDLDSKIRSMAKVHVCCTLYMTVMAWQSL